MSLATISPSGLVEPAFPYIILTNLSIRVAKLEDINQISTEYLCFSHRLEPFLVGYVPTDSTRIEKGKTIVLGELLRTVVGTVILEHVAIVIIIGGTECPVLTVVGKLRTRSTLRAVEYAHSCYIVLKKLYFSSADDEGTGITCTYTKGKNGFKLERSKMVLTERSGRYAVGYICMIVYTIL